MKATEEEIEIICERVKFEMLSLNRTDFVSQPVQEVGASSNWMTTLQLAQHWQLFNNKGEPTTAGIKKWIKRKDFPLPHYFLGDLLRFDRDEADAWLAEASSRRIKAAQ